MVGGFALEAVSLLYNLLTGQPTFPVLVVGLLPIVPGSAALDGVFASIMTPPAGGGGGGRAGGGGGAAASRVDSMGTR